MPNPQYLQHLQHTCYNQPMISLEHISLNVTAGTALDDVSLEIKPEEFVCIVGSSGSGKTLLLNLLTGEDSPTKGKVTVDGVNIHTLPRTLLQFYRREIGVLRQDDEQLVSDRSIAANIALALETRCANKGKMAEHTAALLHRIGLLDKATLLPETLNRGERRRVALAQAIANNPKVLLLDDPLNDLDHKSAEIIKSILGEAQNAGISIVLTTHNPKTIEGCKARIIRLEKGKIVQRESVRSHNYMAKPVNSKQPQKITPRAA